jgi:hypothetical protein
MERRRRITLTASLCVGLILMAWFGHALAEAGRTVPPAPPPTTVSRTADDGTERVVLADDPNNGRGGTVR